MSYLVVNNNGTKKFLLTNTCNKPRLVVSNSYIPLVGNHAGNKVKIANSYLGEYNTYTYTGNQGTITTGTTYLTRNTTTGTTYLTDVSTTSTLYDTVTQYDVSVHWLTDETHTAYRTLSSISGYSYDVSTYSGSTSTTATHWQPNGAGTHTEPVYTILTSTISTHTLYDTWYDDITTTVRGGTYKSVSETGRGYYHSAATGSYSTYYTDSYYISGHSLYNTFFLSHTFIGGTQHSTMSGATINGWTYLTNGHVATTNTRYLTAARTTGTNYGTQITTTGTSYGTKTTNETLTSSSWG